MNFIKNTVPYLSELMSERKNNKNMVMINYRECVKKLVYQKQFARVVT